MSYKGTEEFRLPLKRSTVGSGFYRQRGNMEGRPICYRIDFQITPYTLNGIEFRSIWGKEEG